jgi:7-cyano-7-deazaguanine synthase
MARAAAVVLVSGGMDSAVTLAVARRDLAPAPVAVLHADYGQRTESRERRAFRALADHHGVPAHLRLEISLAHLARIGGSSLLEGGPAVPHGGIPHDRPAPRAGAASPPPDAAAIPSTYVPFRNAHMLAVAVSWAEVLGANSIYVGAVEEDSSGYPDCRREFYDAFELAANLGTRPETRLALLTPLVKLSKGEIVRLGMELGVPFELTWSCYTGEDVACGVCESCQLRLRGFREAGVTDPVPYARP